MCYDRRVRSLQRRDLKPQAIRGDVWDSSLSRRDQTPMSIGGGI